MEAAPPAHLVPLPPLLRTGAPSPPRCAAGIGDLSESRAPWRQARRLRRFPSPCAARAGPRAAALRPVPRIQVTFQVGASPPPPFDSPRPPEGSRHEGAGPLPVCADGKGPLPAWATATPRHIPPTDARVGPRGTNTHTTMRYEHIHAYTYSRRGVRRAHPPSRRRLAPARPAKVPRPRARSPSRARNRPPSHPRRARRARA